MVEEEPRPENIVELPCFVDSYNSLSSLSKIIWVKVKMPENSAFVSANKRDVVLEEQTVKEVGKEGLRARVRAVVRSETDRYYSVETGDEKYSPHWVEVPRSWFEKEVRKREGE